MDGRGSPRGNNIRAHLRLLYMCERQLNWLYLTDTLPFITLGKP